MSTEWDSIFRAQVLQKSLSTFRAQEFQKMVSTFTSQDLLNDSVNLEQKFYCKGSICVEHQIY
jgi:hypothetical protein